ncbi:MAG: mechanosensitive ion channel family protein [Polyangiaceae bacterium]
MIDEKLLNVIYLKATDVGQKLLGAIIVFVVGRLVIGWLKKLIARSLKARSVESTLIHYAESVTNVLFNILLALVILGTVGIETTTFAGLLAAAGLAIGTAWGGLLANFAAGAFLIILRPFRKGDFVSVAGGVVGTVEEIGMFTTTINTMDNVRTILGNNKVFSDGIQNFTANPFRRVDRLAQLAQGADHKQAIALLKARLAKIPHVVSQPAPDVEIVDFTLAGPVLAVRPYCHNDHYWQVYFDTNAAIREELGAAGFPVPETHHHLRGQLTTS